MTLRRATAADSPALTDFLARAFDDEREYFDAEPLHSIEQSFASGHVWLVVESGGTLVGCVCIEVGEERTGRVSQLAVAIEQRGKGIGSGLMTFAEQLLKGAGCTLIYIGVLDFKPEALFRLYRRLGYRDSELDPELLDQPKKPCKMLAMWKSI
jgi:ribosomal protein S18 acetylase RimI-like enzyme